MSSINYVGCVMFFGLCLCVFIYFTIKSSMLSDIYYCNSVIDEFIDSVWLKNVYFLGF